MLVFPKRISLFTSKPVSCIPFRQSACLVSQNLMSSECNKCCGMDCSIYTISGKHSGVIALNVLKNMLNWIDLDYPVNRRLNRSEWSSSSDITLNVYPCAAGNRGWNLLLDCFVSGMSDVSPLHKARQLGSGGSEIRGQCSMAPRLLHM